MKKITIQTPIEDFQEPWGGVHHDGEIQPFPEEIVLRNNQEWGHTREEVERVIKANANIKFGHAIVSTDQTTLMVTIRFFKDEHDGNLYEQDPIEYASLILKEVSFQGSMPPAEYTLAVTVTQTPVTHQVAGVDNFFRFTYNSYWGGDPTDLDTDPGHAILRINGEVKEALTLHSGGNTYSFNVGKYILESSSVVSIEIGNSHDKVRYWNYNIQALILKLSFSDSFLNQQHIAKHSNWEFRLDTVGVESTVYVRVDDGAVMEHDHVVGSTTFMIDTDDTLTTGSHIIEAWAIDPVYGMQTDHITTHFIKAGGSSNVIVIGVNPSTETTLYDVTNIPFFFYAPNTNEGEDVNVNIVLKDGTNEVSRIAETITVDELHSSGIQNAIVHVVDKAYVNKTLTLIISIPTASVSHDIYVNDADIILTQAPECKVYYNLNEKTNSDVDVVANDMKSTYNGVITSHLVRSSNFKLNNEVGFITGEGGFYIPPGKTLTLQDWQPFAVNFGESGNQTGRTISIEFKAGISSNNDIPLISCMDSRCGFNIYPNRIDVEYGSDHVYTYFSEGERISFTLIVNGTTTECVNDDGNGHREVTYKNLAFLCLNGVIVRIFEYGNKSWEQIVKKNIVFGSAEAGVTIYSFGGWEKNITMKELVDNYAFDTPILADKIAIAQRNNILLSDGKTIDINKLSTALPNTPIITWFMEKLPTSKKDPQECKETEFINPTWDKISEANAPFTAGTHEINGDGTSSNAYPLPYKNWAEKFSGFTLHLLEGDEQVQKYSITYGVNKGEKKFVHKVNFASSEGIFNILAMNMYQELTISTSHTVTDLLSKQQQEQADAGHEVTFRKSLSGFPEIGLRKHTVNGEVKTEFISIYNFINNKKTGSMFGMDSDDYTKNQLWEIDENRNFFNTPVTEHTVIDGHVVESNAVRDNEPLYYSRVPADSPVNGGDLGMCADVTKVNQANDEIKALRHIHNWIVSINPNVAKRYYARYGYYRPLTVEEDGWTSKDWGDGTVYTRDTPQYRAQKFIAEYSDHLHLNDCIFYFIFCVWILGKDSMDKNMSLFLDSLEDFYSDNPDIHDYAKVKLRIMLRDTDTTNMFNNTGVLMFKYWHEWNDTYNENTGETGVITGETWNGNTYVVQSSVDGAIPVFNGRLSGLWDAIEQFVPNQIRSIYQSMRNAGLNAQNMMSMYKRFHDYWCEVLYNVDGLGYANTGNLNMAYGDKYLLSEYFYKYRERYMDSKYGVVTNTPRTTMRLSEVPTGMWLKHSTPIYASFSYGAGNPVVTRSIVTDKPAKLPCNSESLSDAVCYINDADLVTEIGVYTQTDDTTNYLGLEGIKNFHFDVAGFSNLVRLRKFIWANTQDSPNIAQTTSNGTIDFTHLKNLKELVMTYCTNWAGNPVIGSEIIEKIDFRGTPITSIVVPETETLTELHLPNSVTSLILKNVPNVNIFSIDSIEHLTAVDIENAGVISSSVANALLNFIEGGGTPALISGKLTLTSLSNDAYWALKEAYHDFEVEHNIDIFVENNILYFEVPNTVYLTYDKTTLDAGVGEGTASIVPTHNDVAVPTLGVIAGTSEYTLEYQLLENGVKVEPVEGIATTTNGSTLNTETGKVTSCNNANDVFSVKVVCTTESSVYTSDTINFVVVNQTYPTVFIDGIDAIVRPGNFSYSSVLSTYSAQIQSVEWLLEGGGGLVTIASQNKNAATLRVPTLTTTANNALLSVIIKFKTCQITAQKAILIQKFVNAIDMGLPSGILWASSNIDVTQSNGFAVSPYQYECSFFSWGNTDGHNPINASTFDYKFNDENYKNSDGAKLEGNISLSQDTARVNCGIAWRMPTREDFDELLSNVDFVQNDGTTVIDASVVDKRITINGITGCYMKSKINGNLLFFATCGYGDDNNRWINKETALRYFSSTIHDVDYAYCFALDESRTNVSIVFKKAGRPIRPVQ